MDDNESCGPARRDDAELDALLLAAKIAGLADLDRALNPQAPAHHQKPNHEKL
jgi:hypothetical protein